MQSITGKFVVTLILAGTCITPAQPPSGMRMNNSCIRVASPAAQPLAPIEMAGADAPSDFSHPAVWPATAMRNPKHAAFFTRMLPLLREVFASEGVPEQLVWLVEVESAFDPLAESRSGAVGLFQLMPETALRYGLQLAPLDERKLPEKSARAAARYLHELHRRFGCWSLVLAAYNAGENRVEYAMRRYALATFDELAPHLPSETRSYVPRVIAIVQSREASL